MNRSGRPRKPSVDDAILRAVADLVTQRGYSGVTVDEVVQRAGTNKPAFYRRFSGLADVVPRILAASHGTDVDIDTGTLRGDLLEVQRRQLLLFTDPVVTRGFAGWLADVDAHPGAGAAFVEGYLAPRREYTRVILGRAVDRGEIADDIDPAVIADLLTGPLLMHAVLPGLPPADEQLVTATIDAALAVLGNHGRESSIDS
jgi:AcrR family transcriptional regulator